MEQTNLVVTPDGKSWDQVTRDVGYLAPETSCLITGNDGSVTDSTFIWDWQRGDFLVNSGVTNSSRMKNFAYGYDRLIFLVDGFYTVSITTYNNTASARMSVRTNSTNTSQLGYELRSTSSDDTMSVTYEKHYKRGDYIHCNTSNNISRDTDYKTQLHITKIG